MVSDTETGWTAAEGNYTKTVSNSKYDTSGNRSYYEQTNETTGKLTRTVWAAAESGYNSLGQMLGYKQTDEVYDVYDVDDVEKPHVVSLRETVVTEWTADFNDGYTDNGECSHFVIKTTKTSAIDGSVQVTTQTRSKTIFDEFSRVIGYTEKIVNQTNNRANIKKEELKDLGFDTDELFNELIIRGYIDEKGNVLDKFKILKNDAEMILDEKYESKKDEIFNILKNLTEITTTIRKDILYYTKGDEVDDPTHISGMQKGYNELVVSSSTNEKAVQNIVTNIRYNTSVVMSDFDSLALNEDEQNNLFENLKTNGYIDENGKVLDKFINLKNIEEFIFG